jgi:hypothetical protein
LLSGCAAKIKEVNEKLKRQEIMIPITENHM